MNKDKGDAYERFICDYLNQNGSIAYLWKDIPPKLLVEANFFDTLDVIRKNRKKFNNTPSTELTLSDCQNLFMDIGVDILQIKNGKFIFVQCKCGYAKSGVGVHDLNGFFLRLICNLHFQGAIYYTHKISETVTNIISRFQNISVECVKMPFNYKPNPIATTVIQTKYILRDYQQKAVDDLTNHLTTNNKCILSFPCAVGKTITAFYVALNYKYVFIVSPFRCHAEQNLNKFEEYDEIKTAKHVLINTDGTRDKDEILKIMNENERVVMSSTFDSVDVINQLLKTITGNYIVIVDEFHNLTKNDVGIFNEFDDEDDIEHPQNEMNKLITTANKILFVSATPRVYDVEGMEDENFNKSMFGENVATMTFNEAIEKKYVTDYKIYIPSIGENYDGLTSNIENEISVNLVKNEILAKCMFLMKGFCSNGNKKCIMYCRNTDEILQFKSMFETLDNYYALGLKYYTVVAETRNRADILQNFSNDDGYSIIFSVRVLDEAVDIPKCDSIYISYSSDAIIRNVQRVFRCNRIDKNNLNKIGHIYVYCDEYKNILNVFASLKEYDSRFVEKIEIMNANMNETRDIKNSVMINNKNLLDTFLLEVKEYVVDKFDRMLESVSKYIDENSKTPSRLKNLTLKQMSYWLSNQKYRYKNKQMKADEKTKWTTFATKYNKHLCDMKQRWINTLADVDEYMALHGRPSSKSADEDISFIGKWLVIQTGNCKNNRNMLKFDNIRNLWENFTAKYSLNNYMVDEWFIMFEQVEYYVIENKKGPSHDSKIDNIQKMGSWTDRQFRNQEQRIGALKYDITYDKWKIFVENYGKYFPSDEEKWFAQMNFLEEYIETNKLLPTRKNITDDEFGEKVKKLFTWLDHQFANFKTRSFIMREDKIYNYWMSFLIKHNGLFSNARRKGFMDKLEI